MPLTQTFVHKKLHYQHQKNITSFSVPCKGRALSCFLLDNKGRSVWETSFNKAKNQSSIEFQINDLKAGSYHLWIEADGKMTVQSVQIATSKKTGLTQLFKNYFT